MRKPPSKPNRIEQKKREIETALSVARGDKVNIVFAIYQIVNSSPQNDQPTLLRHAAELFDVVESNDQVDAVVAITADEKNQMQRKFGGTIDAMLHSLIGANLDEPKFYESLWHMIVCNPFFKTDKEKAFVLYYVLIDAKIPYFKIGMGLKMSNEDFAQRQRKLSLPAAKIRFLLARKFEQRTEQADLILKEFERNNESDRAVLLAFLIQTLTLAGRSNERGTGSA
jgi:hypothetical protein